MPKRDKLFQLVRSLTKTEKRYFSIYTQLHAKSENNDYLKLFRELERQETLDESRIKQNLAGERLLDHYAVTKSYLYDLILKAMRSYSKHSEDKRVLDLIQDVEFLSSKGIFDQAMQLLLKAKEIAEENGLLANLDLLLHWEKRIHMASDFVLFDEQRLQALGAEQSQVQLKRRMQNRLWIKNAMLTGKRMGRNYPFDPLQGLSEAEQQALREIQEHPRNLLPAFFIEVQSMVSQGLYSEAFQALHSMKKEWLERGYYLEFPLLFIRIQKMILEVLFELGRTKELELELQTLGVDADWASLNDFIAAWVRSTPLFYSGYKALVQGDELQLRQFAQSWERRPILDQLYPFGYETKAAFFTGYVFFLKGKHEDAEQEFAKICRAPGEWPCLQTLYAAWIFRLVCHIEMGSWKKVVRVAGRFKERVQSDAENRCVDLGSGLDALCRCLDGSESLAAIDRLKQVDFEHCFGALGRGSLFALATRVFCALNPVDLNPLDWK